ncbi:ATP-binding protein [Janthinobacterium violaceinigrum]|uniref:AAA family ATPase n=1 Tax=Janthinobacterium violaceinigrum TaxID=2654252 RepID=A0A6I1IP78_9BURK|nr:ATP-binding protein [Janthinobacterium violaceinigrum]KAB8065981.1 AAA family ATPase [Janthinobacterium violaceinigrum]
MWVEELTIENIKCFDKLNLKFSSKANPRPQWVTLLSENGGGKTTLLQSLALMLAGPESASQLLPRPIGWLNNEDVAGKISVRLHKDDNDSGNFGDQKKRVSFGYTQHISGSKPITIRSKQHNQPGIHESPDRALTWLRQNAFSPRSEGWFAAGYGAFRRLTRSNQVIVPTLDTPSRYTNFLSQFNEGEELAAFQQWMIYLDYRDAKQKDPDARRLFDLGVAAINGLLPKGVRYSSIDVEGRILFDVNGVKVSTAGLSDGYRSILGLAGDLVWRLIAAFPNSKNPLAEKGVVLIDELDIHLHPLWQRNIAELLRNQFPCIQFIVTTHSPMVAAGAGPDALTLKVGGGAEAVLPITQSLYSMDVDNILRSEAFGLISTFSPQTEKKLNRFSELQTKPVPLKKNEEEELKQLSLFVSENNPYGVEVFSTDLEKKINSLAKVLSK